MKVSIGTLRFGPDVEPELRAALGYRGAEDVVGDRRGEPVRSNPHRSTAALEIAGRRLFRKVYRDATACDEWRWLHVLAGDGYRVPRAVCVARTRQASAVVMEAVPGRAVAEVVRDADADERRRVAAWAVKRVAPVVRRLHEQRWFYRDLYWNHVFVEDLDSDPWLIDVARVLVPRWRHRRWVVKDLASLLSSMPKSFSRADALRFLGAYHGGRLPPQWKRQVVRIVTKAKRIRAHVPKWA